MGFFRRLLSDAVIYSLTPLLSSFVGFLLVPVYTRTFSPSEYGALALVNNTTTLATILVMFGLDASSARWYVEHSDPAERSRTFSTWLAFTSVASMLLAVLAAALRRPLARWLLGDDSLASVWLLFGLNLVAVNVPRIANLWYRMEQAPWLAVGLAALASVGTAVAGIAFVVHFHFGLLGVIGGQALGSWLGAVAAAIGLRRIWRIRSVDHVRLAPMVRFSAPLVLMTNLNWVMSGAVAYFVNFLCSREDAGLYQVANSLSGMLGLVITAFDQAWAPLALAIPEDRVARRVYGVAVEAAFTLGVFLAFAALVFARPALLLITGPQYVSAHWVVGILALNVVLFNIPSVLSVTFARQKKTMPLASATAAGTVVTLAALPPLALKLGKAGAALGVLLGTVTILLLAFRSSQHVFRINVSLRRVGSAAFLVAAWALGFLLVRTFIISFGGSIALGIALTLTLGGALVAVYREPLQRAWAEGRAARGT